MKAINRLPTCADHQPLFHFFNPFRSPRESTPPAGLCQSLPLPLPLAILQPSADLFQSPALLNPCRLMPMSCRSYPYTPRSCAKTTPQQGRSRIFLAKNAWRLSPPRVIFGENNAAPPSGKASFSRTDRMKNGTNFKTPAPRAAGAFSVFPCPASFQLLQAFPFPILHRSDRYIP